MKKNILHTLDLETSTKTGTNRAEPIVSFHWSSQSFSHKEPANQIKNKSTKVDPIISSRTWKNSDEISISYVSHHIKTFFLKNTRSANAHDWDYKWNCHTQRSD